MQNMAPEDTLLTYAETVALLGCSLRTVHRLRQEGTLTPIVKHSLRGRPSVRFDRVQVEALAKTSEVA